MNRISQGYSSGTNWGETFGPTATAPGTQPTSSGIDAWGNLTNRSGVTGKTLTEGLSTSATVKNQLTGYGYDAAGNMISNGSATYTYNAENQLIATGGLSYKYDGDGKRVEKCTEGTTAGTCASGATGTYYWGVAGGETSTETDLAGNVVERYVFFNGQRIARIDASNNAMHYYFSDHLGTHSLVTDANGTMPPQEESDFFPYGGEIPVSGSDTNHYKFTGKERDSESGLDNFGARYLSGALARWQSPDWADGPEPVPYSQLDDPQSLNLYECARNNPVSIVDTDGHELKVAAELQTTVQTLRDESPSFNAELSAHEGAGSPNLTIQFGPTPNDPNGQPSTGNTSVPLAVTDEPTTTDDDNPNHYSPFPDATVTVTINNSISKDQGKVEDTLGHEVGHVNDARTNTDQYGRESQHTKETKGKTDHDSRPEEQAAIRFNNQVKTERKDYKKGRKEQQKHDKRAGKHDKKS